MNDNLVGILSRWSKNENYLNRQLRKPPNAAIIIAPNPNTLNTTNVINMRSSVLPDGCVAFFFTFLPLSPTVKFWFFGAKKQAIIMPQNSTYSKREVAKIQFPLKTITQHPTLKDCI
jgi:hypothetical protein